jgi:hypothetical protein
VNSIRTSERRIIENLGVDFDHTSLGEKKKRNFFDLVSCPGFGA